MYPFAFNLCLIKTAGKRPSQYPIKKITLRLLRPITPLIPSKPLRPLRPKLKFAKALLLFIFDNFIVTLAQTIIL